MLSKSNSKISTPKPELEVEVKAESIVEVKLEVKEDAKEDVKEEEEAKIDVFTKHNEILLK